MNDDKELEPVLARFSKGWGTYVDVNKGWYPIITDLNQKLAYLYPDYEIQQIKEKFGTLRYYCAYGDGGNVKSEIADDLIRLAEYYSGRTCEVCGSCSVRGTQDIRLDEKVKIRSNAGWYKTLCLGCAIERGYEFTEEELEDR